MRLLCASLVAVCAFCVVGIVTAAPQQQFDVATVKVPAPVPLGTSIPVNLGTFRNGTLTLTNVSLGECLQFAYALVSQEQIAGPDWIKSRDVRFDIVAKTAADVGLEQARGMLQALLAERLKIAVHRESRPFSFLALVPAKGGAKLVSATDSQVATGQNAAFRGRIAAQRMPMQGLASLLSRFESALVVDKTGLTDQYQFTLRWTPEARVNGVLAEPTGPSLSEALQQLGLRLESRKESLDVVVVERAEKTPIEN